MYHFDRSIRIVSVTNTHPPEGDEHQFLRRNGFHEKMRKKTTAVDNAEKEEKLKANIGLLKRQKIGINVVPEARQALLPNDM